VLPFVNMSPEPEQDYFCDGISEEITNSLTRVSGLNVIARTSSFHFKGANVDIREVGQRLGADAADGEDPAGEEGRRTARITAGDSDRIRSSHLVGDVPSRAQDVFAIQEEIAQSVADLLRLHMPEVQGPERPSPPDLDAYTRYLRARFLIHQQSPETLQAALEQLRRLTETYPDYALAYSGMAAAGGLLAQFGMISGRDVYPELKANAERGYALILNRWYMHGAGRTSCLV
jgi:serine/threonine-protein kinase